MSIQDRLDDLIGTFVSPHFGMPVNGHRHQTGNRQQENQPHVLTADMGHKMEGMMENCTQQTTNYAHNHAENTPSDHNFRVIFRTLKVFQTYHVIASFFMM
jgi:hypothetical protein